MKRHIHFSFLLGIASALLNSPAQSLPLHRIAASMRCTNPRFSAVRNTKIVEKPLTPVQASAWIASRARSVALRTKTMGWCYKAVKSSLKPFGILLKGGAAWMAGEQLLNDSRFETASLDDLHPGDILVHGRSNCHPYGHIAAYLGNEQEASDHVQSLVDAITYGGTVVFRLKTPISFVVAIGRPHSCRVAG